MANNSKNIVLIGMPGCGKTIIGKLLAEKLGKKFIDIDSLIEKQEGCTINELFRHGEEYFRNLETEAVLALEKEEASVIATGGGTVKRASNIESLKKNGIIVYIDRSVRDIKADIDASTRPLLSNGTDRLVQLYAERHDLYRKYSNFTIKNEGEIAETVKNIIKKFLEEI
jgi:shikimate kinase